MGIDQSRFNNPLIGPKRIEIVPSCKSARSNARIKITVAKVVDDCCCDRLTSVETNYRPICLRFYQDKAVCIRVHFGAWTPHREMSSRLAYRIGC